MRRQNFCDCSVKKFSTDPYIIWYAEDTCWFVGTHVSVSVK